MRAIKLTTFSKFFNVYWKIAIPFIIIFGAYINSKDVHDVSGRYDDSKTTFPEKHLNVSGRYDDSKATFPEKNLKQHQHEHEHDASTAASVPIITTNNIHNNNNNNNNNDNNDNSKATFPEKHLNLSVTYFGFQSINSSSTQWNELEALAELELDLERVGSLVTYKSSQKMKERFKHYAKHRDKSIRSLSSLHHVYTGLLTNIPGMSDKLRDKFYGSVMEIALMINATYVEMESYIEGVKMRGWPFVIDSDVVEFDSFQGGFMMESVALAAEQAALYGDKETAISLALTVAAALHDGFLTKDVKRTKVRDDYRVGYVPASAPNSRRNRFTHLYKHRKGYPIFECPDQPQATNHGLASANAAIALLRAFGAIGWLNSSSDSKSFWRLFDADGMKLELADYLRDLKKFVTASAHVFIDLCTIHKRQKSKGNTGSDGEELYTWKYADMDSSECPSFRNDDSNRLEDIDHAQYEMKFASGVRAVGKDYFGGDANYFGIYDKDIHRLIVAVLECFITDQNAEVNDRFSCDLGGETDPYSKSCSVQRVMPSRVIEASHLLDIAITARDSPEALCDVLTLVNAILPIFLENHEDFHGNHEGIFRYKKNAQFLLAPLLTKYYFYWYEIGNANCQKKKKEQ